MTTHQQAALAEELRELLAEHHGAEFEAHHGDAVGADSQFHSICQDLHIPIIIFPSKDPKDRAYCGGAKAERPARRFREQSQAIVRFCDILIAAPDGFAERLRGSETWMTTGITKGKEDLRLLLSRQRPGDRDRRLIFPKLPKTEQPATVQVDRRGEMVSAAAQQADGDRRREIEAEVQPIRCDARRTAGKRDPRRH